MILRIFIQRIPKQTIFYFLFLPVLLSSCTSAPRKQEIKQNFPVPENWSFQSAKTIKGDSLWWTEFNDGKLDKILDEAFANNYNLQIAALNVGNAAAQAKIAGAPVLPQLDLSANSSKRKQNFIGFPIPGGEGKVLSSTTLTYGLSLNLNWEIDLWGKLRANHAAAIAGVQASQADLWGAGLSLAGQVCKTWFAAVEAQKQLALSEANLKNIQMSTEQVRKRYESGLTSSLDLRMSLSNQAMLKSTLNIRKSQYESIVRQLETLLGRYPSASVDLSGYLPRIKEEVPAGLPARLISRRPDLVSAERLLASANSSVHSAKGALYPGISITGSGGTTTKDLKDLLNGDFSIWSLAGNILQPIFNRGRIKAGVDIAKNSASIAYAQYARAVLNAFAEVENALANENFLKDRQMALETAAAQSIAARKLAEDRYAGGLSSLITLLEAQRSAYDSESQLLTVKRERLDARIDLHLAMGGSFDREKINK